VTGLPYDRPFTTMAEWVMCAACAREYGDPSDRRFHAQPLACPACGPAYALHDVLSPFDKLRVTSDGTNTGSWNAIEAAAAALREGAIVAIKGIGGYHLACDAANAAAVEALRARKYRKERPFALMACDLARARTLIELTDDGEALLTSLARPIVIATARVTFTGVAPENCELGVMLPYTPLQHLLYAAGAPDVLVMTSANRSSEPMVYEDAHALSALGGIADLFLTGERRIARRLDDSVARAAAYGTTILRRARGMAPQAVATVPSSRPILALGGDLKNAPALVVDGQVFAGQYVGDLEHLPCRDALAETVRDLCAMYGVRSDELLIAHDAHPEYASTAFALALGGEPVAVQHHRAHFRGSIASGFERVAHLRSAALPGGDAAARFPVQAAAGFLHEIDGLPDLAAPPFAFPPRYRLAREMIGKNIRTFRTTSMGRLFDAVAALLGFTREISFEGQAAMWLEHLAAGAPPSERRAYELPVCNHELDVRPLFSAMVRDRLRNRDAGAIAYGFHAALAHAVVEVHRIYGDGAQVAASGGVFQNRLLVEMLQERLGDSLLLNRVVPPNDGGLALGQAALVAHSPS
jgi:hydrogenase maturation protein HypF